nr:RNA-dependent RNA polymerase [Narnavirus sp.]
MSDPGIPTFSEERTSAQQERQGVLNVDSAWFRIYCRNNPASLIHGWEGLDWWGRRGRAQCHLPYGLKPDVLDKIASLNGKEAKRLVNLITGFEDNFLFSDPVRFPLTLRTGEFRRFMRWVISTDVYHPGKATTEWKSFITVVKWKAVRSLTEQPAIPTCFPGISRRGDALNRALSKFWTVLCPWLAPIWNRGLANKFECTRLAHFLTSRNLPAGTVRHRNETLLKHARVLCGPGFQTEPKRTYLLQELAYQFGRSLRDRHGASLKEAHASITNSASIDSAVGAGGRAASVRDKFRTWLSEVQTKDVNETTWFGRPYWLKAGTARWRTLCREEIAAEGRPGDSAYITDVDFTPGKYRYEDPLYCLDRFTGYQLYQWSIEEGIRRGLLLGSAYRSPQGLEVGGAPEIRASAIGEPGGKSRVVTVGEDWLTIFLQPISHALIANLRNDASGRAGLSRAWQGFEYTKAWSTKDQNDPPTEEERYILTSDLTTATDYCPREYSEALLKGFTEGLGISGPLITAWIKLLTGPRIYRGPVEEFADSLTVRGSLMGDPGTKVVLSLFNRAAEMESMLRWSIHQHNPRPSHRFLMKQLRCHGVPNSRFRLFAYAGDDHIAVGPIRYLKGITEAHIRNGMKVSTSSNFISKLAGFYCEEIIYIGNSLVWTCWGRQTPLAKQPYEENPHVDALKIRLFSLCSKEHEGKNETNPAIGMASSLRGMIAWFAEGWETLRPICSYRFSQKMRRLLPENVVLRGLPRSLGGLEAPVFGFGREELIQYWNKIPIPIRRAICLVQTSHTTEVQALRRLLSVVSSATTARGIDLDSIEEQVRSVLSSELCQVKPIEALRPSHIDELTWENTRLIDKLKAVSREGKFIPVGEALQVVMRPYVFRDLLFPEESIAHGIDPNRKRAYRQTSWDRRISRLSEAICETVGKSEGLRELYLSVDQSKMDQVGAELISSFDQPYLKSIPKEINLIPKDVVYTDNLCTLRTPDIVILPEMPEDPIEGSAHLQQGGP